MNNLWQLLSARVRDQQLSKARLGTLIAFIVAALGFAIRAARRRLPQPLAISLSSVFKLLEDGAIQELIYSAEGLLSVRLKAAHSRPGARYVARLVPGSESELFKLARSVPSFRYAAPARGLSQIVSAVLPFVFLCVWYKVVKSLVSKEEKYAPPKRGHKPRAAVTFADVASKCKIELAEIVNYLNKPEKYKKAGAHLPRGALLVGPSGTGKTLLAKAVAGEAQCSFISTSASEFVEVYVGRGAARVRDLFRQARESAPAILFIDEIDALGRRCRSGESLSGGTSEYVQLLNQILTELDGFHGHDDGIVIIGATNRHDAIDPALLRPGRFDRHIFVELPDEDERFEILTIHVNRAPACSDLDVSVLHDLASATQGFSGAELANVVNEAVFLALRAKKTQVEPEHLRASLRRAQTTRLRSSSSNQENPFNSAALSQAFLRGGFPLVAAAS